MRHHDHSTGTEARMCEPGLYVVATPIGNLEDITLRALRVLGEVACIAAEDTRHTARLLQHYDIRTPLQAVHEHNEQQAAPALLARIAAGEAVALVSDAGTPLISDPGYRLVVAARAQQLPVFVVPGASAVTAALSVAGLAPDRFVFEGFLPAKAAARRARLKALSTEARTLVLFESSHRVEACMADLCDLFGSQRRAVVCRELTKRFETVHGGTLEELVNWLAADPDQRRGEFVLLVDGAVAAVDDIEQQAQALAAALLEYLPASQAARVAARITGASRQAIYATLLPPNP
jgi:16S rRNA (cytidine1402-2'-O)-methyltransferase